MIPKVFFYMFCTKSAENWVYRNSVFCFVFSRFFFFCIKWILSSEGIDVMFRPKSIQVQLHFTIMRIQCLQDQLQVEKKWCYIFCRILMQHAEWGHGGLQMHIFLDYDAKSFRVLYRGTCDIVVIQLAPTALTKKLPYHCAVLWRVQSEGRVLSQALRPNLSFKRWLWLNCVCYLD